MGTSSTTSKQKAQVEIDRYQRLINSLKEQNARDRETMKNNNSRTGSKATGETCKRRIAQRTEQIKHLQGNVKIWKAEKARRAKNAR